MQSFNLRKLSLMLLPVLGVATLVLPTPTLAQATKAATKSVNPVPVDAIAAEINGHIITMFDIEKQRFFDQSMLGQSLSQTDTLRELVNRQLMLQDAARLGLEVTENGLDEVLNDIATRNNLTLEKMRADIENMRISWEYYVSQVKDNVLIDGIKKQVLSSRLAISDQDIDAFLVQHPTAVLPKGIIEVQEVVKVPKTVVEKTFVPKAIALQHIFVAVPEGADAAANSNAKKKIDAALAEIRRGVSFDKVAQKYSEAAEASKGGDIGIRLFEDWPQLFVNVTKNVQDGATTGVFRAANGFHILKVVERRGIINETKKVVQVDTQQMRTVKKQEPYSPQEQAAMAEGPVEMPEFHTQHILIRTTPVFNEEQAYERIAQIYQRVVNGENFADLAKKYSQDSSAPMGGDLGWLKAEELDPNYVQASLSLPLNQVSQPVRTPFGWHLIKVLDRKSSDVKHLVRRVLARSNLQNQREGKVIEDWIDELRASAYIKNNLVK